MKHFVIILTYKVPFEQLADVLPLHRAFLQTGYDRSWLLMSGPQQPKVGGLIIGRAPSLDEMKEFFKNDPYAVQNVASYQFIEFDPVKRQEFIESWVTG